MSPLDTMQKPMVDEPIDEAEFELDMTFVEATTNIVVMACSTDDGCGSTCSGSACSTGSLDLS